MRISIVHVIGVLGALVAFSPAAAQSDTNQPHADLRPPENQVVAIDVPPPFSIGDGDFIVDRYFSAPRLDSSRIGIAFADQRGVVQVRLLQFKDADPDPEVEMIVPDGFFERVLLIDPSTPFLQPGLAPAIASEGSVAPDETGGSLQIGNENAVWGGMAILEPAMASGRPEIFNHPHHYNSRPTPKPESPADKTRDRITFSSVVLNSGWYLTENLVDENGVEFGTRAAFMAGVLKQSVFNSLDRTEPQNTAAAKPDAAAVGIWSHTDDGVLRLRALTGGDAPNIHSTQPNTPYGTFSEFGLRPFNAESQTGDSFYWESRFSRINPVSMDRFGRISFIATADLSGPGGGSAVGVWSDAYIPERMPEQTLGLMFQANGQLETFTTPLGTSWPTQIRIDKISVPAQSDNLNDPRTAVYGVLRLDGQPEGEEQRGAIIMREPGPQTALELVAIEGEVFGIAGTTDTASFKISDFSGPPFDPLDFPGVTVLGAEINLKDVNAGIDTYHPRPSINRENKVAFHGTMATFNGQTVAPNVNEAVWTTRSAESGQPLELVAREGQNAGIASRPNAVFAQQFEGIFRVYDEQVFHRPVINDLGWVAFLAGWDDPDETDPFRRTGRALYLSKAPGHLECLVASYEPYSEQLLVPDEILPVDVVFSNQICPTPVPQETSLANSISFFSFDSPNLSDCQMAFTAELVQAESPFEHAGWGLFVMALDSAPRLAALTRAPGTNPVGFKLDSSGKPDRLIAGTTIDDMTGYYHTGISYAWGESNGGDAGLHSAGFFSFVTDADDGRGAYENGINFDASLFWMRLTPQDTDGDMVADLCDNCPGVVNPAQSDADFDGIGNHCESCPSDLFEDGVVDGADLAALLADWDINCQYEQCNAEITGDLMVDGADLAQLLAFWGPCPASGSAQQPQSTFANLRPCTSCFCSTDPACTEFGVTFGPAPDFNQDGAVDAEDMKWMVRALGIVGDSRFDMNKDGFVDITDLRLLFDAFEPQSK